MRVVLYVLAGGTLAGLLAGCHGPPKGSGDNRKLTEPSGLTQITIIAKGIE